MALNKRISLFGLTILLSVLVATLIVVITFTGGAKQTVASRSAAAFREAQKKGEPLGAGTHGGHAALSPGAKVQPDHGGHGGSATKKSEHAEQESPDMSGRGMSTSSPSADAHAGHAMVPQGGAGSTPGREGKRQRAAGVHAGMGHGAAGAAPSGRSAGGHAGMEHGGVAVPSTPREATTGASVLRPAAKASEASPGQPAATLQPDLLDRPAETSVLDARRATEMGREMQGGHGMQHGTTSYRQLDAGRNSIVPIPGGAAAPSGFAVTPKREAPHHHGKQPGSQPLAPTPAPQGKQPSSETKTTAPPPVPTHPPHPRRASEAGTHESEDRR